MKIEQFIAQSEGEWQSMRSGHSLAFRQFEQVISLITIKRIESNHPDVISLLNSNNKLKGELSTPFRINWKSESDWNDDDLSNNGEGSCILVPLKNTSREGHILRNKGYSENSQVVSSYKFLEDGTFVMLTDYINSIAEEKIWFISDNVRCRSSVVRTSKGSGILQTSFASEVRKIECT